MSSTPLFQDTLRHGFSCPLLLCFKTLCGMASHVLYSFVSRHCGIFGTRRLLRLSQRHLAANLFPKRLSSVWKIRGRASRGRHFFLLPLSSSLIDVIIGFYKSCSVTLGCILTPRLSVFLPRDFWEDELLKQVVKSPSAGLKILHQRDPFFLHLSRVLASKKEPRCSSSFFVWQLDSKISLFLSLFPG